MTDVRLCSFPGCDRRHHANGYCRLHDRRNRTKGDPTDCGKGRNVPLDWRFERKRTPTDAAECWEWEGARTKDGYGIFWDGTKHERSGANRMIGAHRWAYMRYVGDIPEGHEVCHSCDNPPCVNPSHLYTDTHAANASRAWQLGRNTPLLGEDNPKSKMTAAGVVEARERHAAGGVTIAELAREFGVTPTSMGRIIHRRVWKSV